MPHFEIHVSDGARARAFYKGLFGWSFSAMPGGEEIGYQLIEGADIGEGKGVTGGMMNRMGAAPAAGSPVRGGTMVFDVADCDASYDWALAHGGAVGANLWRLADDGEIDVAEREPCLASEFNCVFEELP